MGGNDAWWRSLGEGEGVSIGTVGTVGTGKQDSVAESKARILEA